jgi:hypothetical protein
MALGILCVDAIPGPKWTPDNDTKLHLVIECARGPVDYRLWGWVRAVVEVAIWAGDWGSRYDDGRCTPSVADREVEEARGWGGVVQDCAAGIADVV